VFVGISGGVDSSVAAAILKDQGHDVVGVYMKNWDSADEAGEAVCPHDADLKSARSVAGHLGVPLVERSFEVQYWESVFEPFLSAYADGRTPNPDIACNRNVKFGSFFEWCVAEGAEVVATGHYARLVRGPASGADDDDDEAGALRDAWAGPESLAAASERGGGRPVVCHAWSAGADDATLLHAADGDKDQSYFLCAVERSALPTVALPLGEMVKGRVREEASRLGLSTASRRDSTGICFIGKRSMRSFLPQYLRPTPGAFVEAEGGREVGRHEGAQLFTVGQAARVSGVAARLFVLSRDVTDGTVWVVDRWDHPALFASSLLLAGAPALPEGASVDVSRLPSAALLLGPEVPPEGAVWRDAAAACRSEGGGPVEASRPWRDQRFNWQLPPSWPGFASLARGEGVRVMAKLNNRMTSAPATLWLADVESRAGLVLRLDRPHRAVSAGQVVALYVPMRGAGGGISGLACAGGAEIAAAGASLADEGVSAVSPDKEALRALGVPEPHKGTTWQTPVVGAAGPGLGWTA